MRRGINLGNALEAPREGDWGYRIEPAHLAAIAGAGFDGVRLPVRWDIHTAHTTPYAIEPAFMARVSEVVEAALALGLKVQLDLHHYEALNTGPGAERDRYMAIWRQIAAQFAGAPDALFFEPLNEPNGDAWRPGVLEQLQADTLTLIRQTHATRLVVFGGPNWNSIDGLRNWSPPANDANIAVTVHYYEPHAFTHENAEWLGAEAPRFGRAWGGREDLAAVQRHAAAAARYATERGLALQLGEFGVNQRVAPDQRAAWTSAVRRAFEAEGATWCYWDFAGAFRIWDGGVFDADLLGALFDQ